MKLLVSAKVTNTGNPLKGWDNGSCEVLMNCSDELNEMIKHLQEIKAFVNGEANQEGFAFKDLTVTIKPIK